MRVTATVSFVLMLMFASGCEIRDTAEMTPGVESERATGDATDLTPEELAEIGAEIEKDPARAHEVLDEYGISHESFETAIRNLTEDPEASRRYAEEFERRSS
jgi:hypothetical protein